VILSALHQLRLLLIDLLLLFKLRFFCFLSTFIKQVICIFRCKLSQFASRPHQRSVSARHFSLKNPILILFLSRGKPWTHLQGSPCRGMTLSSQSVGCAGSNDILHRLCGCTFLWPAAETFVLELGAGRAEQGWLVSADLIRLPWRVFTPFNQIMGCGKANNSPNWSADAFHVFSQLTGKELP
jgi:hypothetical protein